MSWEVKVANHLPDVPPSHPGLTGSESLIGTQISILIKHSMNNCIVENPELFCIFILVRLS